jgi:hypothetical protein
MMFSPAPPPGALPRAVRVGVEGTERVFRAAFGYLVGHHLAVLVRVEPREEERGVRHLGRGDLERAPEGLLPERAAGRVRRRPAREVERVFVRRRRRAREGGHPVHDPQPVAGARVVGAQPSVAGDDELRAIRVAPQERRPVRLAEPEARDAEELAAVAGVDDEDGPLGPAVAREHEQSVEQHRRRADAEAVPRMRQPQLPLHRAVEPERDQPVVPEVRDHALAVRHRRGQRRTGVGVRVLGMGRALERFPPQLLAARALDRDDDVASVLEPGEEDASTDDARRRVPAGHRDLPEHALLERELRRQRRITRDAQPARAAELRPVGLHGGRGGRADGERENERCEHGDLPLRGTGAGCYAPRSPSRA